MALTKNSEDTCSVDVNGHGSGTLKPYEGNLMSIISEMADDDEDNLKED